MITKEIQHAENDICNNISATNYHFLIDIYIIQQVVYEARDRQWRQISSHCLSFRVFIIDIAAVQYTKMLKI